MAFAEPCANPGHATYPRWTSIVSSVKHEKTAKLLSVPMTLLTLRCFRDTTHRHGYMDRKWRKKVAFNPPTSTAPDRYIRSMKPPDGHSHSVWLLLNSCHAATYIFALLNFFLNRNWTVGFAMRCCIAFLVHSCPYSWKSHTLALVALNRKFFSKMKPLLPD